MENRRTRVIVSAEEADHHSFKKPAGRMYVTFYRCFRFDHPSPEWSSNLPFDKRHFSFPLSAFADAATARPFLDSALTTLFVRFPNRFTLWQERGAAAPCPIDGLAGASQKIAERDASIAALSVGTSPGILVKVQKLAPVTSTGIGREEARGYFDGETEEGSRMWVSAEQITREGEADNARVEVAIQLSRRLEGPTHRVVTPVATHQFSFPLAAFASTTTAVGVLAPAITGLRIRPPTLGLFWRDAADDTTLVPVYSPYPSPTEATFWRNGDEEWSHPIAGLAAASEKIAELGLTMGAPGKISVNIHKISVMQRPENVRHFTSADWDNYLSALKEMEDALFFYHKIELYDGGNEGSEKLTCPIWIRFVEIGCHLASLPCTHMFHEDCIKLWGKRSRTCPYCRSRF